MVALAREERERFLEQGYLVVQDVVPDSLRRDVIEAICETLGVDQQHPASWDSRRGDGHGIVPLHHHPSLWRVRQLPAVHRVFSELYQMDALWVSMDRVSFKPPLRRGDEPPRASSVHWDCDPRTFRGLGIQGLVYLTDTEADQGAFTCVPELFHHLPAWLEEHAEDENLRRPDVMGLELVRVPGPAGSLVLWHRLMPHTSATNNSATPRFVQYVAMSPVGSSEDRQVRTRDFEERRPPAWALRQNVPGQRNPEPWKPIELSPLGRKLVGFDDW